MRRILISLLAALALATAPALSAKTLRWSSQGDFLTADPHAQNESLTNAINGQVYESLVTRGKKLEIVPQLAIAWKQMSPTVWIFSLRKNVKFHDGAPFTADDVVFSIERAQGPTSNFRVYGNALGKPRKIDDYTVELTTPVPNPVQLEMLVDVYIMNKAWSVKNHAEKTQDFINKEESHTSRNANGTGPYVLVLRDPDVKSHFRKNPAWWGIADKRFEGNVDEIVYTPIKSESTRMAALLSGELDVVLDPPVQNLEQMKKNPQLKVYEGRENRVIFLGMDQARDELLYSNVKGKNPFKDRRVRQAFYQAIDIEAIKSQVMRGLSVPTGTTLPNPTAAGIPADLQNRLPHDVNAAKKLLADAGYPNGFEVTLDCPNNRYINDEKICIAVAGMLAKISVNVKVNAMPRAQYFPKAQKLDTSFYMLGWGGSTTDAIFMLQPVLHSRNDKGDGDYNWGNYKDEKFDALIDALKGETDMKKRQGMIIDAVKMHADNVYHLPLHLQVIPWAARANVQLIHRADNRLEAAWVTL